MVGNIYGGQAVVQEDWLSDGGAMERDRRYNQILVPS